MDASDASMATVVGQLVEGLSREFQGFLELRILAFDCFFFDLLVDVYDMSMFFSILFMDEYSLLIQRWMLVN